MDCTTLLPIKDEEENLEPLVLDLIDIYKDKKIDGEVLLLENSSKDNSRKICDQLASEHENVRVIHLENETRSTAIQIGFKNARGEAIIVMDSDREYEVDEIPKFLNKLKEGYDIVSGDRVKNQHKFYRKVLSKLYNSFLDKTFALGIKDCLSGFKGFKRDVVLALGLNKNEYFDFYKLLPPLAKLKGYKLAEVPIRHYKRYAGRSHFRFRNLFLALKDLRRFKKEFGDELKKLAH